MTSNSLSVKKGKASLPDRIIVPTHIETFTSCVTGGINSYGFHIADEESLYVLWDAPEMTPIEKLQRIHAFASEHGWEVAARNKVTSVLFQAAGRRAILPAMWRLCGMN